MENYNDKPALQNLNIAMSSQEMLRKQNELMKEIIEIKNMLRSLGDKLIQHT